MQYLINFLSGKFGTSSEIGKYLNVALQTNLIMEILHKPY